MKHEEELERILNEALTPYREAEPLAGLEERVLQRVHREGVRRLRSGWRWGLVAAGAAAIAAALVTVAVWIGLNTRAPRSITPAPIAQKPAPTARPQPAVAQDAALRPKTGSRERHAVPTALLAGSRHEPMREQFPAPVPLTQQERVLVALARTDPAVLQALQDTNPSTEIAPITIEPLGEITGGAKGEN